MKKALLYIAGAMTLVWGVAHLFPTAGVVKDFGDISNDNKMIITMEWMVEGFCLIFIGLLTLVVTLTDTESILARRIYLLTAGMLIAMAILSLFTGFKVDFLPFKLCPPIFSVSAILIIVGTMMKERKLST